jgi:hypothetical protein
MSQTEVTQGSPWKSSSAETIAALRLAREGLLPIGASGSVNVIELLAQLDSGDITAEQISQRYEVNGKVEQRRTL